MDCIKSINEFLDENNYSKKIRRLDKYGRIIIPFKNMNDNFTCYVQIKIIDNLIVLEKEQVPCGIKVNKSGRITIPKEIKKILNWSNKDLIEIYCYNENCIIMKKSQIQSISNEKNKTVF